MAHQHRLSRKAFLKTTGALVGGAALAAGVPPAWTAFAQGHARDFGDLEAAELADRIIHRVKPPHFRRQRFLITDYGAVGDGQTDCTTAFASAIAACARRGGGHVVVPAGTFLTGPIHLQSNVDLNVTRGATIKFSQDPTSYLPAVYTRWQGIELYNYSPFVYAFGQENVALTGSGTLDGQADPSHWTPWKTQNIETPDWNLLQQMAQQGVPVQQRVFGAGHFLRPNFVQFYRCRNVLIEGVTIVNSPMWEMHPCLSRNVLVRGVTVNSHWSNNDGCDPESCDDVLIERCTFDTGDDCIAIKAGRDWDGRRLGVPSQNVLIQDCEFRDGHGGVTIGSEMSGGVRNVVARNLTMTSTNIRSCLRLKTNSYRGGFIQDIFLQRASSAAVTFAGIEIDFFYELGAGGGFDPLVQNIDVRRLRVAGSNQYALYLRGYPEDPIHHIHLTDCTFDGVKGNKGQLNVVENVDDLQLRHVLLNGQPLSLS